jgi:hypothetical protein
VRIVGDASVNACNFAERVWAFAASFASTLDFRSGGPWQA